MSNTFLGKITLFSFLLLGIAAISAPSVLAAGDTKTRSAKTAQATNTSAMKKTTSSTRKPRSKKKKKATLRKKKHNK